MGVIAMKTLGAGAILQQKAATREECLRYVWSLPIATAILGCQEIGQVETNIAQARTVKPMSANAMEMLRERVRGMQLASMEPWKQMPATAESSYRAD